MVSIMHHASTWRRPRRTQQKEDVSVPTGDHIPGIVTR
jgi:hypothetical protein